MASTSLGFPLFQLTDNADIASKLNAISQALDDYLTDLLTTVVSATSVMSAIAGQTITSGSLARSGKSVTMALTLTLPAISVPASGNIANTKIAQINDIRFIPAVTAPLIGGPLGPVLNGYVDNTGAVFIGSFGPGQADIAAGTGQSIGSSFVAA